MRNPLRRWLLFVVATVGGLALLVGALLLLTRSPRPISPTPTPAAQVVATVNGEPIEAQEWERAARIDQVMSALVGQASPGPEETLEQLINERLVLQAAEQAGVPQADSAQTQAWLDVFLTSWGLDETTLDQALAQAGLTRADLMEDVVPRLLRVDQALNALAPEGDAEAWVAELRDQARVEVLEHLTISLPQLPTPPRPTPPSSPTPSGAGIGTQAPDFSLSAVDGGVVTLADLKGRPVLLNFWATWCAPCRAELPLLRGLDRTELVVLGINVRESSAAVTTFADELGLEMTLLLDPDGRVSAAYQVRGLPTSLFIGQDGLIVARHVGPLDPAALEGYLDTLLAAPADSGP